MAANDETRKKEPKKKASFDGTADAFLFAAGAAAFAARWEKKRKKTKTRLLRRRALWRVR
jgi:hypothetical protein